ncbi:hypothetical protein FHS19_005144 [Paenibacillus rhizosphaerae]|uniref:Uncharacterized protein n=1 Tax=Paenibacillus rhizosphaerae TaxID=297318 RepID=A0A839TYZ4_9BACL|nr:hypothetical protein [Paenibacillus rhizosphaerae]MBB3130439.1 hypothetical protein [Paenibacillus rhizosphaerae]
MTYTFGMKKKVFLEDNAPKNDKAARSLLPLSAMEFDGTVDAIYHRPLFNVSQYQ